MPNAARDENGRTTIICASNSDGITVVQIKAEASTHALHVNDDTVGSDAGDNGGSAMLDGNGVAAWTALSSDGSGSIVEVYGEPITGSVLIDSN